jgi:hypothetical protein
MVRPDHHPLLSQLPTWLLTAPPLTGPIMLLVLIHNGVVYGCRQTVGNVNHLNVSPRLSRAGVKTSAQSVYPLHVASFTNTSWVSATT